MVQSKPISAKRVVITSFAVDILDVVTNLAISILTGSVIMITQVLRGTSDLAAAGFLVYGIKQSEKPADIKHPFGHGQEIYFWAMLSALVMFGITATLSFYLGMQRFLNPQELNNISLAYLTLIITALANAYSLSLSLKRLSKSMKLLELPKIFLNSPLIETKTTFVLDLMGTASSILGLIALILFGITQDLRFDGLGTMLISIVLSIMAFLLLKGVKDLLVGKSASTAEAEKIREAALKIPEVKNVLDLRTMYLGPEKLLVNLEVHLKDNLTTDEIEVLVDKIKESIKSQVPDVHHIQVELETPEEKS